MPTDDERREVARKLRWWTQENDGVACVCADRCLGLEPDERFFGRSVYTSESISRLADLIEPAPERTCQMNESEFADFDPECKGLHFCHKCGEQTAVMACVNEDGDTEWIKPRFCGFCGAKAVANADSR